ncbi:bifunctional diguanylate cyclase/phosphodiesterase [Massilia horti]|uniref:GGDEF and EAL domain-containing protein n=1 Tax=Massilia horti TaxID=2562153 RepID=A0A4Y9T0H2_9BURK|nr:EAL domain-containing protein [Massilia horti]TFW32254.1 GGDEF and EAL domain-containing protein [Massilia horti]
MFTTYDCIVFEHDLRLVILAAVICTISSFTAINLLHHVGRSRGTIRSVWLCVAGTATGFGIWATHFIAMLAYSPGIQSGYNVALTFVSLIAAILLTILSFAVASAPALKFGRWFGGALVGGGIAVMHYTGMAAFEIPGRIVWNPPLVAASIALGALFGALALPIGLRSRTNRSLASGALLLTIAICSHHFTAMAAAALILDPSITVSPNAIPRDWLAIMVTIACFGIFLLTFAGFALDVRERRLAKREMERLNSLADAAFEGLLVVENDVITTANASLAALAGCSAEELVGSDLSQILPDKMARHWLEEKSRIAFETTLHPVNGGEPISVEATSRPVVYAQRLQRIVAIRDLRDRKQAERDIHYLAHHDTLTGLANRNTFNQELEQLLQAHEPGGALRGKHLAVLCLDLDRFKEVNDLFGHAAGDDLLRTVARRAQQALRRGQLMARLGGDEFAIIAPGLSEPGQAERIAQDLSQAFEDENRHASTSSAMISTSIGIAVFPQDANDSTSLMSCADTALYRAKAEGRGTYRFFEAAMGEQMRDRRRLEHELRFAIAKQELSLVYQPQARTNSREIVGFEALVRWHHEERGPVPPSVFIPIAEEYGLILQIGEWVLRQACKEAARWERPLSVAVNVSTAQLHSPNFVRITREILMQTGLPPSRLELEITETALIRDPGRALIALRQLKELGVRIAMDDFGTGYSSLTNLLAFPFDKIKIDGSFIKSVHVNRHAATIVRAVLGLGHGLELPVLAEGVETEEELAFLCAESCQEAQGYLLGKPQAIEKYLHVTTDRSAEDTLSPPAHESNPA